MIQGFKRFFFTVAHQPGRTLLLSGAAFFLLSLITGSIALDLLALAFLTPAAIWLRVKPLPVGANFAALPSMPLLDGKPYLFLFQHRRSDASDKSCHELLRSLISDKNKLNTRLPKGVYCTITHDSVIHVLQKCDNVQLDDEPKLLYRDTLRLILTHQTGGRCRRCKARCAAWNSEARNFYLVRFTVS